MRMRVPYGRLMIVLLVYLLLACLPASAAAPITHAYCTERFLAYYPYAEEADNEAFMMGSQFPDIRYLCQLPRSETHFAPVTLAEILAEPSPFLAGMKFHSYVDIEREKFHENEGIYPFLQALHCVEPIMLLKLTEDEILFSLFSRDHWHGILEKIHPEERCFKISDNVLMRWHRSISKTLALLPSVYLQMAIDQEHTLFNKPIETLEAMQREIGGLTTKAEIINHTLKLISHFEELFTW